MAKEFPGAEFRLLICRYILEVFPFSLRDERLSGGPYGEILERSNDRENLSVAVRNRKEDGIRSCRVAINTPIWQTAGLIEDSERVLGGCASNCEEEGEDNSHDGR